MPILLPPPFNPLSLFDSFGLSESDVQDQLSQFEEFSKPENVAERQKQRDNRLKEIDVESGEIINSLIEKCEAEKNKEPEIDPETGIIFIRDGCFDDCEDCNDVECLLESKCSEKERELLKNLHQEKLNIEEKNNNDLFELQDPPVELPFPEEEIDKKLIDKYKQMIMDWGLHVITNGIVIPGAVPSIVSAIINPLIATPPLAEITATEVWKQHIKPYNDAHSAFLEGIAKEIEEYNKPENVEKRKQERLDRRNDLEEELGKLKAQLEKEENKFDEINDANNTNVIEEVILISTDIKEEEEFEDGFSFNQDQLDRIKKLSSIVLGELTVLKNFEYLFIESSRMEDDVKRHVVNRLLEKSSLISDLEQKRINLINTIEAIESQDQSFDIDIIAVQAQIMEEVVKIFRDRSVPNILGIAVSIKNFVRGDVVISNAKKSIEYSHRINLDDIKRFSEEIESVYPEAKDIFNFNDKLGSMIDSMFNDLNGLNGPNILQKNNVLRSILNNEKSDVESEISTYDEDAEEVIPLEEELAEIESGLFTVGKIVDYQVIVEIVNNIKSLETRLPDFINSVQNIDLRGNTSEIFGEYDFIVSRHNSVVDSTLGEAVKLSESQYGNVSSAINSRDDINKDLNIFYSAFSEQETRRSENRNELLEETKKDFADIESSLSDANDLPDDTEKIHSFNVILQVAELLESDKDKMLELINDKEKELEDLIARKELKENELSELDRTDVILLPSTANIQKEIEDLENSIASIEIPDYEVFSNNSVVLINELRYALSNSISDIKDLIEAIEFELNNPDVDSPFIPPPDTFDEVQNACEAIMYGFMSHLVKYGFAVVVVTLPVPPFSSIDTGFFASSLQSRNAIRPFATKVANQIKSGSSMSSLAELVPTIINKIVLGLYFQSSSYLSLTGRMIGASTGGVGAII